LRLPKKACSDKEVLFRQGRTFENPFYSLFSRFIRS
jgi:hypothetical protein